MSEIIKKICVGKDTKTLVLKIHGDLGSLKVNSCDNCNKKDSFSDKGFDKNSKEDGNNSNEKTNDEICSAEVEHSVRANPNISVIGSKGRLTSLYHVSPVENGFLAVGESQNESLLTEFDNDFKLKKAVIFKNAGSKFKSAKKIDGHYILVFEHSIGGGFMVVDSNYKTTSSYHITHSGEGISNFNYIINNIYKASNDFTGDAAYLCPFDTKGYGNTLVAFDKNYKMIKFVSTPGKDGMDIAVSKDKIVGVSSIDNKGYLFVADSSLIVNKQIIYNIEKGICKFKKIIKTEKGYLVLGDLDDVDNKSNLLLLKLDEDLKILDNKTIRCPFIFNPLSFSKNQDGGYIISGHTKSTKPDVFAFMIVLDKDLNVENSLALKGSKYEDFSSSSQINDGTYMLCGHTKSVGYEEDSYIITFKGDIAKLNNQKIEKYPSLLIDCDYKCTVSTGASLTANDKVDYVPNYTKLYSGHELKFDSIKSDGESTSLMVQDPNRKIWGA